MLTAQSCLVTSGIATCSLEPSCKVASTKGSDLSSRRPESLSIRSTACLISVAVSSKGMRSVTEPLAIKTCPGELIQTSSIPGSSSSCCKEPKPTSWFLIEPFSASSSWPLIPEELSKASSMALLMAVSRFSEPLATSSLARSVSSVRLFECMPYADKI